MEVSLCLTVVAEPEEDRPRVSLRLEPQDKKEEKETRCPKAIYCEVVGTLALLVFYCLKLV